jgi:hypothetical protein
MIQLYATVDNRTEEYLDDVAPILTALAGQLLDGDESIDAIVARLVDSLLESLAPELTAIVTAGVVGS